MIQRKKKIKSDASTIEFRVRIGAVEIYVKGNSRDEYIRRQIEWAKEVPIEANKSMGESFGFLVEELLERFKPRVPVESQRD